MSQKPGRTRRKPSRKLQRAFVAESLEQRQLFALSHGGYDVGSSIYIGSPDQAGGEYSAGQVTAAPKSTLPIDVVVGSTYSGSGNSDPDPTGVVTISDFDTQQVIATLTLVGAGYSQGITPVGINAGAAYSVASGMITVPSASMTLVADYAGDGNYPGDNSYNNAYLNGTSGGVLEVNPIVQSQLQFIQGPSDVAVGDKITPPITVQVQDEDGAPKTSANDQITLSLGSATTGKGRLGGTLSEPAVNGVATFNNVTVDAGGAYVLHAADSSDNTVTGTNSTTFHVSAGKLVFTKAPHDGSANAAINPSIVVELEDAKNKIITDSDGTTVTLSLVGANSGVQVTGNTAVLSGGKATFSAFTIKSPGYYQLAADDGVDAEATAPKFQIVGDHLVITKQPADVDAGDPITFGVSLRDAKNKVDTLDSTDQVAVSLNLPTTGSAATLDGVTTLTLNAGVATFTSDQNLKIGVPGKYTLTATALDSTGVLLAGTSAVNSKAFNVGPYHLVVTQKAASAVGVNEPVEFAVTAYDKHGKVYTDLNAGFAVVNLQSFQNTFTSPFTNGVATFKAPSAPVLSTVGTYQFIVTAEDANGNPLNQFGGTVHFNVKVQADHLVYTTQPVDVSFGISETVVVVIEDLKNKVVTAFDGNLAVLTAQPIGRTPTPYFASPEPTFSNGKATFEDSLLSGSGVNLETVGSFQLTIKLDVGNEVEPGVSHMFKVTPYKAVFTRQPQSGPTGSTFSTTIILRNAQNQEVDTLPAGVLKQPGGDSGLTFTIGLVDADDKSKFYGYPAGQHAGPGQPATDYVPSQLRSCSADRRKAGHLRGGHVRQPVYRKFRGRGTGYIQPNVYGVIRTSKGTWRGPCDQLRRLRPLLDSINAIAYPSSRAEP